MSDIAWSSRKSKRYLVMEGREKLEKEKVRVGHMWVEGGGGDGGVERERSGKRRTRFLGLVNV